MTNTRETYASRSDNELMTTKEVMSSMKREALSLGIFGVTAASQVSAPIENALYDIDTLFNKTQPEGREDEFVETD